ncbi:metal-sensitive transcriptional regulator [Leptospira sp. WS58.C1]|jgi:CsoR family transcriptional regulator, copper-sensing transcriptional repressor|uniref:metal-sensitive transcriptional regulator n=1 Tax=Leptospira TaxID=171 RepID=UPI0002BF2208|nr:MULTISPECIES: metal-sensitive transcriptional regulator [unclassified Leptospira]EMJ98723.1 metal-sensitive transcriptional repressor [Leptospira sp. B5-022]MCR1792178.1 metal-sensing transcriptional repressor [Leptospira sp. id769339]
MELDEIRKQLTHRLHRIKGQLDAIEKNLYNKDDDCEKTIILLKASSQALKKFGEAYVQDYMDKCFSEKKAPSSIQKNLKKAIKAAFSL